MYESKNYIYYGSNSEKVKKNRTSRVMKNQQNDCGQVEHEIFP